MRGILGGHCCWVPSGQLRSARSECVPILTIHSQFLMSACFTWFLTSRQLSANKFKASSVLGKSWLPIRLMMSVATLPYAPESFCRRFGRGKCSAPFQLTTKP